MRNNIMFLCKSEAWTFLWGKKIQLENKPLNKTNRNSTF